MAQAPPPNPPAGVTLRGVVVEAGTGTVLPRARVHITTGRTVAASIFTDDQGAFTAAAEGPMAIKITKAGYATTTIDVTAEQVGAAPGARRFEIPRGAAVSGRVVVLRGDSAAARLPLEIRRVGAAGGPAPEFCAIPDERGEYRVGGLPAGRYAIGPLGTPGLPVPTGDAVIATSVGPVRMKVVDLPAGADVTGVDIVFERVIVTPTGAEQGISGTGSIRGRVSTTEGQPLADATVTVRLGPDRVFARASWMTTTDGRGSFAFDGLPAGSFRLGRTKAGYLDYPERERGADVPAPTVVLRDGEQLDDVQLVMMRGSVISGIVVDEHGEPIQDATVGLVSISGSVAGGAVQSTQDPCGTRTDDRGQFRLFDVVAGTHLLRASVPRETHSEPAAGSRLAYAPAYYPGTPDLAGAAPLEISNGQDVSGLIVVMRRIPVVRVSGLALTSRGMPLKGTLRLARRRVGSAAFDVRQVRADDTGRFAFADVPPGEYTLEGRADAAGSGREFASTIVTVGESGPEPLTIRTSPGSMVSGRFVLEGASGGEQLWGYSMRPVPVEPTSSAPSRSTVSSPVSSGIEFTMSALAGPTRLLFSSPDENWFLKSVLVNGFEAADAPFDFGFDGRAYTDVEVIFARPAATISGRATDDRAAPVHAYAVIVFPTDRDKWFAGSRWLKVAHSTASGEFRVAALPPGDYWIAAVDRVGGNATAGEWQEPDLLEALSLRANRASLGPGESPPLALRLIRR